MKMTSESNKVKINSVKTNLQIAYIFTILVNIPFAILVILVSVLPFIAALSGPLSIYTGIGTIIAPLLLIIPILIFWIPSYMIMKRTGKLYNAAKRYDVSTLKAYNSTMWAVLALIFTGVIPGILLLMSNGPLSELDERATQKQTPITDPLEKLGKLKGLLDKGAITKEEFEEQKKKIMESMD